MKAITFARYGSPDVLQLQEIDPPAVQDDDVRGRILHDLERFVGGADVRHDGDVRRSVEDLLDAFAEEGSRSESSTGVRWLIDPLDGTTN